MKPSNLFAVLIFLVSSYHRIEVCAMLNITDEAVEFSTKLIAAIENKVAYTHPNDFIDKIREITELFDKFLNETRNLRDFELVEKCALVKELSYTQIVVNYSVTKDEIMLDFHDDLSFFLQTNCTNFRDLDLYTVTVAQRKPLNYSHNLYGYKFQTLHELLTVPGGQILYIIANKTQVIIFISFIHTHDIFLSIIYIDRFIMKL